LKKHLDKTGAWLGDKPAIVIRSSLPPDVTFAVLCHEVSHILPVAPDARHITHASVESEKTSWLKWARDENREQLPNFPRWVAGRHDKFFVRRVIHCWWRCALHGCFPELQRLYSGSGLDLLPPTFFWRALEGEPIALQRKTFSEIEALPPPAAFDELWSDNLAHWMHRHPQQVQEVMEAA
jgi:hypothetical protein